MSRTIWFVVCVLAISGVASAQEKAAPRISHTFPPPEDIRSPDRTLAHFDTGPVRLITYSPDGRTLITAGADNNIRVFEARTGEQGTGELVRTLKGHKGRVLAIGFSADGKSLLSIGDDETINKWDLASGRLASSIPFKLTADDSKQERVVAFRPGSQPQLAESAGSKMILRNYETGEVVKQFEPHAETITAATFTPDGKRLIVGTRTGAVRTWDLEGQGAVVGMDYEPSVKCLAASANRFLAGWAVGYAGICENDAKSGMPPQMTEAHHGAVTAVSIRGDQFATAGEDKLAKVWDVATSQLLCIQEGHTAPIVSVAINQAHGQKMATGDAAGNVKYWTMPLPPIPPADLEKIKAALPEKATATPKQPRKLLVFWRADAILHKSGVPAANKAIELMGEKTHAYTADFTRDYEALDPKVLANYDGLVLNSTAHLAIPDLAKQALLDYAKGGHGIIGIHAAIDTFRDWPEGAAIIGATFGGHPWVPSGNWVVKLEEPDHPLLKAWGGKNFKMHDEVYELAAPYSRADRRVLMSLDLTDPATAGVTPLHREDKDFAVSWIKRFGQGRVFFCMFGHLGQPFQNPAVLQYYLDGIQYALGDLAVDDTPRTANKN